jgi:hypothetical protein
MPHIQPSLPPLGLEAHGAQLDEAGCSHTGKLAIVELRSSAPTPSDLAGTEKFSPITRYS